MITPEGPLEDADEIDRRVFWPLLAAGALIAAWGVRQLFERNVDLRDFGLWFIAGVALHDLVLAPLVFVAGAVIARVVPGRPRAAVQAGLIVAGIVLLYAIPGLFGDGADARDPSRLPNDVPRSVAIVLALVTLLTLGAAALRRRRRAAP